MTDINLYLKIAALPRQFKMELEDYVDFIYSKKIKEKLVVKKHPKAGCMKGSFTIGKNFDEPLDDFKEYMQ